MSKAIAWPPKVLNTNDYEPTSQTPSFIRSQSFQDLVESLNYSTAMIGMGQVIGQSWEKDVFSIGGEAGQYLVNRWGSLPKIIRNQQKLKVYVKAYWFEDIVTAGDPTIILRTRDEALNLIDTETEAVSNDTTGQWIVFDILDVPEGDTFSFDLLVEGAVDGKIVFIESVQASYVPLYEEDMAGDKTLVYSPLDSAYGTIENADLNPYTSIIDQPVAFAFATAEVAPDKPLSAVLVQSIRATIQSLISRERIYCLWQGTTHEEDSFGYMPAHYVVGAYINWVFQSSIDRIKENESWNPTRTLGTTRIDYTPDYYAEEEENFDQSVYTPIYPLFSSGNVPELTGIPARDSVYVDNDNPLTSRGHLIYLTDDVGLVDGYHTETPISEPPWVGTYIEREDRNFSSSFISPNLEMYDKFYHTVSEFPRPNILRHIRFPYLRHSRSVIIDGAIRNIVPDLYSLMPWGYVTGWFQKGV